MTSLRARQINRDIRNRDEMIFRGVLANATAAHERAMSEAVVCPHCPMPVHPSNHDAHMERYHKGVLLSEYDKDRLNRLEAAIEEGLNGFREAAVSLSIIQSDRLYRDEYPTFEAYCKGRWGKSRSWGYSLIKAEAITAFLSSIVDSDELPVRESQTRALSAENMPEGFVADVWTLALNTTPNHDPKEVTAAHLRSVTEVVNEAIATEGYVDPGTGESEPVSPVAFKAAVLATTVEKLSRQWEHMTRKRAKLYSGAVNRARVVDDQFSRLIEVSLPLDTNLDELRAAIASGKPITVTLTTEKDAS